MIETQLVYHWTTLISRYKIDSVQTYRRLSPFLHRLHELLVFPLIPLIAYSFFFFFFSWVLFLLPRQILYHRYFRLSRRFSFAQHTIVSINSLSFFSPLHPVLLLAYSYTIFIPSHIQPVRYHTPKTLSTMAFRWHWPVHMASRLALTI